MIGQDYQHPTHEDHELEFGELDRETVIQHASTLVEDSSELGNHMERSTDKTDKVVCDEMALEGVVHA